jgi:spore coat polysaccharide biosynthesis protein SpsF
MANSPDRIVAIVQARMGSTRLPGKVLMELGGSTVLSRVLARLRRSRWIDQIVVATTSSGLDHVIDLECQRIGVCCFRGSEDDVLDRFYQTAQNYHAEAVVRITADCPLTDPGLVDDVIQVFQNQHADYANNTVLRTYPRGLDVEVFTYAALSQAWQEASKRYEREHVTPYFYEHPTLFRMTSASGQTDYSRYRWTLDTLEDLRLIRAIYARFRNEDDFSWLDVIAVLEKEPQLAELNGHVLQKSLHGD